MKVLLITARYLPHRGGLETVVSHLAQGFQSAGHAAAVITNRYPRTLPMREVIGDIPIDRLSFLLPEKRFLASKRLDLFFAGCYYAFHTTRRLNALVQEFRPEIINLHYLGAPAAFLSKIRHRTSAPIIVSLHGGDVDGEPHRSASALQLFQSVTQQADGVTACSQNLADQAFALAMGIRNKTTVIHNGVDSVRFTNATPYPHIKPYIAAVGQLVLHKGFDLLIDAFGDIAERHATIDLLILGEGSQRSQLQEQIAARRLEGRVHLLGRGDEPQVASLMAGCLLLAVPSRREPFGIVALEGMAAGKPVFATPVGGIPEFLETRHNRLIAPERALWAKELDTWLTAEPPLDTVAGNRECARRFTWDKVVADYLQVYRHAQARRSYR